MVQTIRGSIEAGEARGTASAVRRRQRGSAAVFYAVLISLTALGGAMGWAVERSTGLTPPIGVLNGMLIGWIVYVLGAPRFSAWRFRQAMQARGQSLRFETSLSVTDEALERETAGVRTIAQWSAVTDLFLVKGYWVLMVNSEPWFAPRRFFANADGERAFLGEALARMTPQAVARSSQAVALVAAS